ncbi:PKD domain-containing protein [Haloarcula nitratireducens]|uniref:PKD domain-containing protein n=1 Tax=Haloarcula nitratireducens TaxID=2487749 RepID=A0AAW4P9S4_9EURY|nr:PKD domain-containing protein [Halomicroarcula nitratireducens]MBX0294042.1 PKD domain-containing protein [Halomicroarcula nitratireducens]
MERDTLAITSIAWILLVVGASITPFTPVGTAAGNVENVEERPDAYAVVQGSQCIPLATVGDASQNVSTYYDYRGGNDSDYSSHGTDDLQVSGVSQLYVYRGESGDSLVFLHDSRNDDTGGGAVSMDITGIPTQAGWAVEDDNYDGQDDSFEHTDTTSEIDWQWQPARNDGGALRGIAHLSGSDGIEISASFGTNSDSPDSDWAEDPVAWRARSPSGLVELDKSQSVSVVAGSCPTADLTATPADPAVGANVTFDASGSTPAADIVSYRWDVGDDGSFEAQTARPTFERAFDTAGEKTVAVVVEDANGRQSEANATVTVGSSQQVDAVIEAPGSALVGDAVQFDGRNSTAGQSATYQWAFGDGATATGPVPTHTYGSAGTYDATLTVTDGGQSDTANATLVVEANASDDPTAALSGPATATVGQSVTFDASNSTAPRGGATYQWDVNADGTVETETSQPTLTTAFDAPGDRTVGVTVVDRTNRSATASTTVTVERQSQGGGGGNGDDGGDDDSSSGGSTGGGGAAPPPSDDGPPATATRTDEGVRVEVSDPGTGTVGVALDDGTLGSGPAAVQRLALADARAGTTLTVTDAWNGSGGPPTGSDETLLALDPTVEGGSAPSSVTYQIALDREAIRNRGGSVESLAVATWTGSDWQAAETTVVNNGSTVVVNATAGPETPLAVGLARPNMVGGELTVEGNAVAEQPVNVTATLTNAGQLDGTKTITAVLGGRVVGSERVTLGPGETRRVTMSVVPAAPGRQRLTIAGQSRMVDVAPSEANISQPTVTVERDAVNPGEPVRVTATFTNDGTESGTVTASFVAFGDVVGTERLTVAAGASETVTFEQRIEQPGQYTVGVNGQNASVTVDGDATQRRSETPADGNGEPDGGMSPLFLGLVAVGSVGVLAGGIVVLSRQL